VSSNSEIKELFEKLNISNEEFEYFFKYIENKKNGYQLEEKNLI
jgi:arginyl-tRNA--protein-N-Asp/Glu arginylyltransferase